MARRTTTTILVVDDDERVGRACADLFGRQPSVEVSTVASGKEALAHIRRSPPDAVITELDLPGMDGLTLLRQVRRTWPDVACVVLTDVPSARSASRALRLGADDYIIKGADSAEQLRRALREALRNRAREAEVKKLLVELTDLNEAFLDEMANLHKANLELEARLKPPEQRTGAWRMLVVDDEPATVELLKALLTSQGFDVDGAESGEAARRQFRANAYDLVLTDKNLGDANGVDLIKEIHAIHPETRVLLMTGFATVESAVDAMHLGAVGYLRKPFADLDVVIERVDEVLDDIKDEREKARYNYQVRARNAEFVNRFKLLKTKLMTLQREQA